MAVELEIDKATFETQIRGVWIAADIGTVIHPLFAEGQVIGGATQGLGYALLESAVYERGVMKNARFTDYTIPTALDTPPMQRELRAGAVLARAVRREGRRRAADGHSGAGGGRGRAPGHRPLRGRAADHSRAVAAALAKDAAA